jgi:hypothetical protein
MLSIGKQLTAEQRLSKAVVDIMGSPQVRCSRRCPHDRRSLSGGQHTNGVYQRT